MFRLEFNIRPLVMLTPASRKNPPHRRSKHFRFQVHRIKPTNGACVPKALQMRYKRLEVVFEARGDPKQFARTQGH